MSKCLYPAYYDKFLCSADKCTDTCCTNWEICLDEASLRFYDSVPGDFGKRLKNSISKNSEGEYVFLLKDGRCPFLNDRNLCDIHITLGEEHTCEVCKQHPRFIEEYDGFTEICLSASCPQANKLIFSSSEFSKTYPTPDVVTTDELLNALIKSRKQIFGVFSDTCKLRDLVKFSVEQSKSISDEFYEYDDCYEKFYEYNPEILKKTENFLLKNSEILTEKWKKLLKNSSKILLNFADVSVFISKNDLNLCRAFAYLIYRYFLKSVNDEEVELNCAYILLCLFLCIDISAKTNADFCECFGIFSKEIEHNLDNIDLIKDFIINNS